MLKLFRVPSFNLEIINSKISGWSTRKIPILAPRLFPPCLITSVAALKTVIKESGPEDTP